MTNKCKSPWVGVLVELNGSVKSCCSGTYYWGNLHDNTIEEIINSPKVINLKQQIIEDQEVDYCSNCRKDEKVSGSSQRGYYDRFTASDELLNSATEFKLRNIDIRWNALCNLNCVYCNEFSSTQWQKYKNIPIESARRSYYDHVLEYINTNSEGLESILLVGGEPLMHIQNKHLLESVSTGLPINIITNLSSDLKRCPVFDVLRTMTNVGWDVSLETVGSRFDYVRHGANWDRIVNNITTLKDLPGHYIVLFPVYCIYSATNLLELYEFAYEHNIDLHLQLLSYPDFLTVTSFGPKVKQRAIDEIDRVLALPYIDKFDQGATKIFLETMRNTITSTNNKQHCGREFLTWCKTYEQQYASDVPSFDTLWPELYELINNDLAEIVLEY